MIDCAAARNLVEKRTSGGSWTSQETADFAAHLGTCPNCKFVYGAVMLLEKAVQAGKMLPSEVIATVEEAVKTGETTGLDELLSNLS